MPRNEIERTLTAVVYEVTDDKGKRIGRDVQRVLLPEDQNRVTVVQRLTDALDQLAQAETTLAGTPTNAQTLAAVRLCVRVCKGLVRMQVNDFAAAD